VESASERPGFWKSQAGYAEEQPADDGAGRGKTYRRGEDEDSRIETVAGQVGLWRVSYGVAFMTRSLWPKIFIGWFVYSVAFVAARARERDRLCSAALEAGYATRAH